MAADIDNFIRQQKAKLATERRTLAQDKVPTERRLPKDDEDYTAIWSKVHRQQGRAERDTGGRRWERDSSARVKKRREVEEYYDEWEKTHKKQKRVDRDTHSRRVERDSSPRTKQRQEMEEYYDVWEKMHKKKSPRSQAVATAATDVDTGRKQESPPPTDTRNARILDRLVERKLSDMEYKKIWKEIHKGEQSQKQGNRSWREPSEEKLLPVGQNESKKKQLEVERNREYNEYLKSKDGGNRTWREPSAEKLLPLGEYEQKRRAVEDARKSEYQDFLRKNAGKNSRRLWKEATHEELLLSDVPHMRKKEKLRSERQAEYKQYLRERNTERTHLAHQTDEYKAKVSFPGMNESDNAKIQKERARNAEYNQHLREKNEGGRKGNLSLDKQDPEYFATLPGMRDSDSAKKKKELQRNAEYNLYLQSKRLPAKTGDPGRPPIAPRNVWATPVPSYDEMLDRKRQQEASYRRTNDPSYDAPLESERKLADLDKELEKKKARIRNERQSQGVLEDPAWLSPRKGPSDVQYEDLTRRESTHHQSSSNFASLPLGPDFSEYEKKRQQEQYRHDLERQMREAEDGKRREREFQRAGDPRGMGYRERAMDLKVDYSGYIDPEARKAPTVVMASSRRPRQNLVTNYQSTLQQSLEKLDDISPRSEIILGRRRLGEFERGGGGRLGGSLSLNRGTTRGGGIGVSDSGFENMMDPPRLSALAPPPGLEYQPASYITQGGGGGVGQSSVDEAYSFYATRNPLEETQAGGGRGDSDGGRRGAGVIGSDGGRFGGRGVSKARIEEEKRYGAGRPMDFPSDEDYKRVNQAKAQNYQEELSRQIEENRRKKMKEKEEKDRYDRKLEQEARDYNPYGRGGGGAPMRDSHGNLISDLRSMHLDNENVNSPRRAPNPVYASPRGPVDIRDDLIRPPPVQTTAEGEQSYARGGHGIFGMPKTDSEKLASEKYKIDLMKQIEEKKYHEMRKKEKQREEEEREQRKVMEQQRRMQEEYEEERRRAREKEEEARKKNEELVRLAEERRREADLRRRDADDRRLEQERREREADEATHVTDRRGDSPPVPAARARREPQPSTSRDTPPPARPQSAVVLDQLANMRKQLQIERQRVENMLQNERNDPDVFDPRLVQRPPPAPVVRSDIDVFETARNRNPVPVHRDRTPVERPNTQAVEDFGSLKYKGDSDSRKEFRRLFPDQPSTGENLEAQQAALLKHQEENLRRLRDQRQNEGYPSTSVRPPSSQTPKQLHSKSAFVDVDNLNYFPDDFDDIPNSRRNNSGIPRRRGRRDSSPSVGGRASNDVFGSTTSLNVDRLSKKNEQRLRKLREMQGDDTSLYDPDDVLDRFMSKQVHNRPPSGQTLQDDTWMNSGSKASGY